MKSVYCLTLKTLLRSLKTYIYFAVTLIATGGFFTYVNLSNGYSGVEYSIEFLEIALLLTLPLISAELFTADRQCGFEKTLLTYGITTEKLFFGTFGYQRAENQTLIYDLDVKEIITGVVPFAECDPAFMPDKPQSVIKTIVEINKE